MNSTGNNPQSRFPMDITEAQNLVRKLKPYIGRLLRPFTSPVRDFIILPAVQKDFMAMLQDMENNKTTFDSAIMPYRSDVTVLVYSEDVSNLDSTNHCSLEQFLELNSIDLSNIH